MLKKKKFLGIVIVTLLILILNSFNVFAADFEPKNAEDQIKESSTVAGTVKDIGEQVIGVIRVVGTMISIAAITVIGIKYMMGSVEEKAEYKKALMPYLIGSVILFAAVNLAQTIYKWSVDTIKVT